MASNEMLNLLSKALNATTLRQEMISNNISNVNTRNYKAKRVAFEDEFKSALNGTDKSLMTTNEKHLSLNRSLANIQPRVIEQTGSEMRLDGNNVDIDMEMSNLAANQLRYNALIQQTNSKISTLRFIISEGKR